LDVHLEEQFVVIVKYRRIGVVVHLGAVHIEVDAFLDIVDKFREATSERYDPSWE
jgi:hypothetical protein